MRVHVVQCGYEFPWSPYRLLPFSGSSTAHDYHHSVSRPLRTCCLVCSSQHTCLLTLLAPFHCVAVQHNVGNFASFFTWWDRAMGTDQAFVRYERKQVALRAAQAQAQAKVDAMHKDNKGH
jgi:sterol desaturase/sphingolipid hydroxylase (fatty acid hydroxylase superfamily)